MRDQAAHRGFAPAVPAWLRPTAGDRHFWRIGAFFEGRCTFLDSYFSSRVLSLGYTKEVHITSTTILGHRDRRPIAINHEGFSMMLLRECFILV